MFAKVIRILFLFALVVCLNSCCTPDPPPIVETRLEPTIKAFKKWVKEEKYGFAYYYLSEDTQERYSYFQFDHALTNKKELRELIEDVEIKNIEFLDGKDDEQANSAKVTFFTKKFNKNKAFKFVKEDEESEDKKNGEVKLIKLRVWKLIFYIRDVEQDIREWQEEQRRNKGG